MSREKPDSVNCRQSGAYRGDIKSTSPTGAFAPRYGSRLAPQDVPRGQTVRYTAGDVPYGLSPWYAHRGVPYGHKINEPHWGFRLRVWKSGTSRCRTGRTVPSVLGDTPEPSLRIIPSVRGDTPEPSLRIPEKLTGEPSPCQKDFSLSRRMVTGPSLTRETFISARKRPVSTWIPFSRQAAMRRS